MKLRFPAFILFLLGCVSTKAATGDVKWATIDTNGWVLNVCLENVATNAAFNFGFQTNNSGPSKVILKVTSPGYDTGGAPTNIVRSLYGTRQLRLPYPNQAIQDVTAVGSDTIIRLALSDYVFQGDTSPSCSIAAGWYANNQANSLVTVTNLSTMTYPRTIGNWTGVNWDRISGPTFPLRCVAFNRFGMNGSPVACVVFSASDSHGHSTSRTVPMPTVDPSPGDAVPVVEFIGNLDASGLTQGDVITCNFKAYPWVGDAGSVLDTSDGVHPVTTPYYHPLSLLCDKTGGYGRAIAVVAPGGTSAGLVITNALDPNSPPAAFNTIANAANAIQKVNSARFGHNDSGGGTIYLRSGAYRFDGIPDVAAPTWTTIAGYPTDDPETCNINASTSSSRTSALAKFQNLRVNADIPFAFYNYKAWWFDHCLFDVTNSGSALIDKGMVFFTSCTISTLDQGLVQYAADPTTFALIRGNSILGPCSPWQCYTVVGNQCTFTNATNVRIKTGLSGAPFTMDETILAYNKLLGMNCNNAGCVTLWSGSENLLRGAAVVQNIFENISPQDVVLGIHPDSSTGNVTNVMLWSNVIVGERCNLAYNDIGTSPAWCVLWSVKNNIWDDYNIKSDTFEGTSGPQGARVGNWANAWGVGFSGNANLERIKMPGGGGFLNYFIGLNSFQPAISNGDPPNCVPTAPEFAQWVHYSAWSGSSTNGMGNGFYQMQAASPIATSWHPDWALPFDIAGGRRSPSDPAGAFASTLGEPSPNRPSPPQSVSISP